VSTLAQVRYHAAMRSRILPACLAAAVLAGTAGARAQPPAAVLAPTGTLRAVFLGLNPVQGRVDPATGTASGPVPEIVEALAKKFGVPFTIASSPNAAGIASALAARRADIGFLAYDVEREGVVDYGAPLLVMFNSYLVRRDSPIARSADVDRSGVTVGAVRGQTQEYFVSRTLRNATVRRFDTMPPQREVEALLTGGGVDAFAINRQRSLEAEAASGGTLRALPDSFLEVDQDFVVAKGDRAKLPILERFANEIRASGFIKASIDRAGLAGVGVARPSK
jgi:polar amino acid transport system substrate-binding protein